MPFKRISVAEARDLIEQRKALVVDVRDRASFENGHIPGAQSVDESNVGRFLEEADHERPLLVCCYHGNMSQSAADYFSRNGFSETFSLDGGFEAWKTNVAPAAPEPLPAAFGTLPASARIWIYGAPAPLTPPETEALGNHRAGFLSEWQSHGREVTPGWSLLEGQFLVVGTDEEAMSLSGCSIDSMFRAVEAFGRDAGIAFERGGNQIFFRDGQTIRSIDRAGFGDLASKGAVTPDTLVFDTTISRKEDLDRGLLERPLRDTWHMKAFGRHFARD
jgi:thiosulfate sulfurtransferase